MYALEELIETLQEEQQVSHDETSVHTQCPPRELARLFAERGWPWYLTGGLGDSVWIEWLFLFTCLPQGGDSSEVAELRASLQEKIDIIESMREQVT